MHIVISEDVLMTDAPELFVPAQTSVDLGSTVPLSKLVSGVAALPASETTAGLGRQLNELNNNALDDGEDLDEENYLIEDIVAIDTHGVSPM